MINGQEKLILQMAERYKEKPEEFVRELETGFEKSLYVNRGHFFFEVGNILKSSYPYLAMDFWQRATSYYYAIGDKTGGLKCYKNLGELLKRLGNFKGALDTFKYSLQLANEIGDVITKFQCYIDIGVCNRNLGNFSEAVECYKNALKITKNAEVLCYPNLSNAYIGLGKFNEALESSQRTQIIEDIADNSEYWKSLKARCYTVRADILLHVGRLEESAFFSMEGLNIAKEIGDKGTESLCYMNLGNAYFRLKKFKQAIRSYNDALKLARNESEKLKYLASLGVGYLGLKKFKDAIRFSEDALKIAEKTENFDLIARCYGNIGIASYYLKDSKRATDACTKALTIAERIMNIDLQQTLNFELGRICYENKELLLAYEYLKRSVEFAETIGRNLAEEEYKIGFYSLGSDVYEYMIRVCLELTKKEEAFEYTERSKSKAFLDMLSITSEIRSSSEHELIQLLGQEKNVLVQLREIQTRHVRNKTTATEIGKGDRLLKELNKIYERIEVIDPEYVSLRRARSLPVIKIQNLLSRRYNGAVLVEYFVMIDKTLIFVISPHEFHLKTIEISQQKIARYVNSYMSEVVGYDPEHMYIHNTWLELSNYLIQPISEYLNEGSLIYFVPHGLLHYVPFHALKLNGEFLIRSNPVAYSPSASLLQFYKNKGSGLLRTFASFGIVFKKEAKEIAKVFHTNAYSNATRSTVLQHLGSDMLHFSCHGYFDEIDPLRSGIVLYDNDILTARQIFDLKLNAELVTLSACKTGINKTRPGDELVGLTRALIYAGAASVIVSLWSVDANSTKELMVNFYRILTKGKDIATALQEAQNGIIEKQEYSHPYYWAPFVLIGDWQ